MADAGRRCRFYFWNDLHLRAPELLAEHPTYPGANERAAWALDCALGHTDLEPPDFVLAGGDMINGEIPDYHVDYAFLQSFLLDRLTVPYLPCLGNHENRQGEGIPGQNAAYDRWFGPQWHNYVFSVGGVGFIVLDTSGGHRTPDEVTAARNAWAAQAFDMLPDLPLFVVTHVPLIALRELEPLKKSFGFSSWKVLDDGLLDLVDRHAERIIAVLCGHIHLTGVKERGGVWHIMPSGIGSHPSDFAAVDLYGDRVEVAMVAPPEELLGPAGNIHGAGRHGVDYTDAEHPEHHSYIWGNAGERRVTIPLAGQRLPLPLGEGEGEGSRPRVTAGNRPR